MQELEKVHELFVEELEDIPRPSTDINALQLMQQR